MFKKGQSGNPKGRPRDSRNIITKKVDALVEARAQEVIDSVLKRAVPYGIYCVSFKLEDRVTAVEKEIKEIRARLDR